MAIVGCHKKKTFYELLDVNFDLSLMPTIMLKVKKLATATGTYKQKPQRLQLIKLLFIPVKIIAAYNFYILVIWKGKGNIAKNVT